MAALTNTSLSIADAAKRMTQDGKILSIAELLNQKNGITQDIPWVEGDTAMGHQSVQRTSLPTVYTKVANAGVTASSSTTTMLMEAPETVEGWSKIEKDVYEFGGNGPAKRAQEAASFTESMNQTVADRLIYGNGNTTPGQINGLAFRFSSTSANNGDNVIPCGGSGSDNASVWVIKWKPGEVYGWYPKGSPGGLQTEDFGKVVEYDSTAGTEKVVYKEQFRWSFGLAVDDWRAIVRLCNIDISAIVAGSGVNLFDKLNQAVECINDIENGSPVIYMNRTAAMCFRIQARNAVMGGGQLNYSVVDGKPKRDFNGIPIRILDRLTESESVVS